MAAPVVADSRALTGELFTARQQLAAEARRATELEATVSELRGCQSESKARIEALENNVKDLREYRLRCESLEGTVETLQQEAHRLKSARQVLDQELKEAREAADSHARDTASLQGAAALAKAKIDDQTGQLRIAKQQVLDLEEEVQHYLRPVPSCCCLPFAFSARHKLTLTTWVAACGGGIGCTSSQAAADRGREAFASSGRSRDAHSIRRAHRRPHGAESSASSGTRRRQEGCRCAPQPARARCSHEPDVPTSTPVPTDALERHGPQLLQCILWTLIKYRALI